MQRDADRKTPFPFPFPARREGETNNPDGQGWQTSGWLYQKLRYPARDMRKNPAPAEARLWQAIRERQIDGIKLRRQHTIGQFIVDFYSREAKLIIEIDGPIHELTSGHDASRQQYLESLGFKVIRFTNDEVLNTLENVLQQIHLALSSSPSPRAGKGPGDGVKP